MGELGCKDDESVLFCQVAPYAALNQSVPFSTVHRNQHTHFFDISAGRNVIEYNNRMFMHRFVVRIFERSGAALKRISGFRRGIQPVYQTDEQEQAGDFLIHIKGVD